MSILCHGEILYGPLIASQWVLLSTKLWNRTQGKVEHKTHHIQTIAEVGGRLNKKAPKNSVPEWTWWALEFDTIAKKAGMIQFSGAVLFLISVLFSLARRDGSDIIIPAEKWVLQDVVIWGLQIIGSLCFLYAACAFYLEIQNRSCIPKIHLLECHIQGWYILGAFGFLLCAVFGLFTNYKGAEVCCDTDMMLSSFWGSVAFLISSILMIVEVANKHPNAAD